MNHTSDTVINALVPNKSFYPCQANGNHLLAIAKLGINLDTLSNEDIMVIHFIFKHTGKEIRKALKNVDEFKDKVEDFLDNISVEEIVKLQNLVGDQMKEMFSTSLEFEKEGSDKKKEEQG